VSFAIPETDNYVAHKYVHVKRGAVPYLFVRA
jgi:hypothetical protein